MSKKQVILSGLACVIIISFIFINSNSDLFGQIKISRNKTDNQASKNITDLLTCRKTTPIKFSEAPDKKIADAKIKELNGLTQNIINSYSIIDSPEKKASFLKSIIDRKQLLIEVMKQAPVAARLNIFTEKLDQSLRKNINSLSSECLENLTTAEGVLTVEHVDFPDNGKEYFFLKMTNGRSIILNFTELPAFPLISGIKIKVKGYLIDEEMLVEGDSYDPMATNPSSSNTQIMSFPENQDNNGDQKSITLMINFSDIGQEIVADTNEEVVQNMIKESDSYLREVSFQKSWLTSDTFGWYTVANQQTCDWQVYNQIVEAADPYVNYAKYKKIIIVAPFGPNCDWGGAGTVGAKEIATQDGTLSLSVVLLREDRPYAYHLNHEIGHNFGFYHGNFYWCDKVAFSTDNCESIEYYDLYSTMGYSKYLGHFSTPDKESAGWLKPENSVQVKTNGQYILHPLEVATNDLQALKIPGPGAINFYIEFRQPIGYDQTILNEFPFIDIHQGASIHFIKNNYGNYTQLLDLSPPNENINLLYPYTPALKVNKTFVEPTGGTKIKVLSLTPGQTPEESLLTVDVQLGKTDFTPPEIAIVSPEEGTLISGEITIKATAEDESGIKKLEFFDETCKYSSCYDGQLLKSFDTPPYEFTIDSKTILHNGRHYLYAVASDQSGAVNGSENNIGESKKIGITVQNTGDTEPPSIQLTAPADGSMVTNPLTISAQATDDIGIWRVVFLQDIYAVDYYAPYFNEQILTPGKTYRVRAEAEDLSGKIVQSDPIVFTVISDTIPPVVKIISPLDASKLLNGEIEIVADIMDNGHIKNTIFFIDDIEVANKNESPYQIIWDATKAKSGHHKIKVTALDLENNQGSSEITINLTTPDPTPPTVKILITNYIALNNLNQNIVQGTLNISAIADDVDGIKVVKFYIDDGILIGEDADYPYGLKWDSTTTKNGAHKIYAVAYDKANPPNSGESDYFSFVLANGPKKRLK